MFKTVPNRQHLLGRAEEDIVISLPGNVSTKSNVPELVEAADSFYFPADAVKLNELLPSEFYARAVKHCFKGLQNVVGLQKHYFAILSDNKRYRQEKRQLVKEIEELKEFRTKGEALEGEVESLKNDLGKTVSQFEEAASRAKLYEDRAESSSRLAEARAAEIEQLKRAYADMEAAKLSLEVDLADECKKFESLELDSNSKELTTRIFALEQVVSGSLTPEKAKEELEILQSML